MTRAGFIAVLLLPGLATAAPLRVGPDRELATPSAAARVAQDGDTIQIDPGEYYDCAVWRQNDLTIEGAGPGVTITDVTCMGKAIFVVAGDRTSIRDLTLARARVPDGNGAGIRAEGQGLMLERVRFFNNQVGLLSGVTGPGTIDILDCGFERGGTVGERTTYAISIGGSAALRIRGSHFSGFRGGQILSGATLTEILGNDIVADTEPTPAAPVILVGGRSTIADNRFSVGPPPPQRSAAILAMSQGPTEVRGNRLSNRTDRPIALLLDWSSSSATVGGNDIAPTDSERSTNGYLRHLLFSTARGGIDAGRHAMFIARQWVLSRIGRQ